MVLGQGFVGRLLLVPCVVSWAPSCLFSVGTVNCMFMYSPDSYAETLTTHRMVLGSGVTGMELDHEGGALMMG